MTTSIRSRARRLVPTGVRGVLAASLTVLIVAACGGGGGGSGGMLLNAVSMSPNAIWQINRPIQFSFSEDVDFSTVNMNSIHIGVTNGGTAVGEFTLLDSKTVQFQPRCPTLADNSDAGLQPGGISYFVLVPAEGQGVSSVHSVSGDALSNTLTIPFTTVNSTDPAVLFIDLKAGPPSPVIRTSADDTSPGSYIEVGDDPDQREYFITRSPVDVDLGLGMPQDAAYLSGLNLYSDVSSHLSILIAVDQSVAATPDNINTNTIQLQYLSGTTTWIDVAHSVTLVANCSGTGALLRVSPSGILPQNHMVRVRFAAEFKDIVGNANIIPVVVASFPVGVATDPGTNTPGPASDEFKEEFTVDAAQSPNSYEDTTTTLADPRADWASQGLLKAGFAFTGTGGHNGVFDWKIGNDQPLSNTNHPVVNLDTAFTQIQSENSDFENVIGGIVDIRNFTVTASGTLLISGPNPCQILVSGTAVINGRIQLVGASNLSVGTLDTTGQTEPGALGTAGGGNGGNGNPLTTQSSPKGANGNGAFNALAIGGVGGESAYQPRWPVDGDDSHRRPAGGGGGTLGHDFLRPSGIVSNYTNTSQCADQSVVGYDAESGFHGYFPVATDTVSVGAIGVITNQSPPVGGAAGPRPFVDSNPENDFWGTMLHNSDQQLIHGELASPWAGAGGGGGGNAIVSNHFPTTPFDPTGDEKGAGGGGGGGSLTILALGSITFGPTGRIDASGGTGGGGENSLQTGDVTHIGGGSGGGSGGHIILQTASQIDMSAMDSTPVPSPAWSGGLYALGGQGGAGKNNIGGAQPLGNAVPPCSDALPPPVSYPTAGGTDTPKGVCAMTTANGDGGYSCTNHVGDPSSLGGYGDGPALVVICCGGDGGPGLIQLHAPANSIHAPNTGQNNIYSCCKPPPVGSFPGTGVPLYSDPNNLSINHPETWNPLLPIFGRQTQALSKWISLGDASVSSDVSASTPNPIQLFFRGTDGQGNVVSSGTQVAELPPILTGTIQSGTTKPYIDTDLRTIVFDSSTLVDTDDIYLRNVLLLQRFLIRVSNPAAFDFEVAAVSYDPASNTLRLTVDASGTPLQGMEGAQVEVRPRFFRVVTSNTPNFLPASSKITIEFQATQPDSQGNPSTDPNLLSPWTTDITTLDPSTGTNPNYRFLRFRVSFDIAANGGDLTPDTPIPGLDFLRTPFRF
jgi:hypothetical protein